MIIKLWEKINRHMEKVLKLIVGLGLIGIVVHFVDLRKLMDSFMQMNPWFVLPMIVLIYASRALMAYKWGLLLYALRIRAPFWLLFQLYIVSPTVGNVISGVGAELFRAHGVSSDSTDAKTVLASIAMERALGLFALLIFVLISLGLASYLLAGKLAVLSHLWWVPSLSALIFVVVFVASG